MQLGQAVSIANRIVAHLNASCTRIDVAGSVRRMRPEVKDIEVVALPRLEAGSQNIFGAPEEWRHSTEFVQRVTQLGTVLKGQPATGRYVKVDIRSKSGDHVIMLDLFLPQRVDYVRQLAIRTGSAAYSGRIARRWVEMGWVGTEDGLRRASECRKVGEHKYVCEVATPTLPPAWLHEEHFFSWLDMPYVEPQYRYE